MAPSRSVTPSSPTRTARPIDSFRMRPTISTVDLVKSWLGQALRATGAAIVVPVAILVALSLTALGGSGLSGLGSLSQVVAGPQVAGSAPVVNGGDAEIGDAVDQLAAADSARAAAGPVGTGGGAGGSTGGSGGGAQAPAGTTPGSGGGGAPGGGGPVGGVEPPGGGNGGGNGNGGGGEPPPEPPGLVESTGNTVKDVTAGTPVAPTVEDAVDGLVETCRGLGCP